MSRGPALRDNVLREIRNVGCCENVGLSVDLCVVMKVVLFVLRFIRVVVNFS